MGVKLFGGGQRPPGGAVISSHGLSDTGCVRPDNEDRILVDEKLGLFAVADGMGGHSFGEVAAELALLAMQQYIDSSRDRSDVTWPFGYDFNLSLDGNRLATAVLLANRRVWKRSEELPQYAGMGTTIAAVLIGGDRATVANVGDSRVYLLRRSELRALTADDTWVGAMVRQGTLDPSEVPHHPMRNVLTQAAGAREDINVQLLEQELADGDQLMISSDGLHGVVEEGDMQSILSEAGNLGRSADGLIAAARNQGAPDNVSCILLRYSSDHNPA